MGAAEFDHKQLETEINLHTGRLNIAPLISTSPYDLSHTRERIYLKGACLNRNLEKMFSIMSKLFFDNKWRNPDLLKNLLGQMQSSMIEAIPSSGLSYAKIHSSSMFSRSGYLSEQWHGLSHVRFTNDIIARNDLNAIIDKLIAINHFIVDRSLLSNCITTERDTVPQVKQHLSTFLNNFQIGNTPQIINPFTAITEPITPGYFAIPATVNYISKTMRGVHYLHEDSPRLEVLAK
eukprot:gene9227-10823_t